MTRTLHYLIEIALDDEGNEIQEVCDASFDETDLEYAFLAPLETENGYELAELEVETPLTVPEEFFLLCQTDRVVSTHFDFDEALDEQLNQSIELQSDDLYVVAIGLDREECD